ncbi:MAG TPA: hypothetical protein VGQ89_16040 [Candidatus Limnocylindrales bacterium]|jgi:hypothetical protein|nr:hypothetical protein [Candidatus Limnocylindrales bacterium]
MTLAHKLHPDRFSASRNDLFRRLESWRASGVLAPASEEPE